MLQILEPLVHLEGRMGAESVGKSKAQTCKKARTVIQVTRMRDLIANWIRSAVVLRLNSSIMRYL